MTQEEKDLLLKDLCARLPYGVICKSVNFTNPTKLVSIDLDSPAHDTYFCINDDGAMWNDYDEIKPYLFPLSSMTEEQKVEFEKMSELDYEYITTQIKNDTPNWTSGLNRFNWLIKNHFDVYNLIPIGLAIDATGKNIY